MTLTRDTHMPAKALSAISMQPCWTTFLGALSTALNAGGTRCSLAELAGRTGFAFRLNVRDDVDSSGPTTYPHAEVTRRALDQMGWDFDYFAAAPGDNTFGRRQAKAIAAIEESIGRGIPAVAWGISLAEYGLIAGFDSDERAFEVSTVLGAQADAAGLPYGELGLGAGKLLDVVVLRDRVTVNDRKVALDSLKIAVGHALGAEPHYAGYANGLAGYALWMEALRDGRAHLFGTAYNVQLYGEARRLAREYLAGLAGDKALDKPSRAGEAAEDYRRVADNFASLEELFPFRPDLPRDEKAGADAAKEAVELLERALFWERSAVNKLEQALKDNITR